MNLDARPSQVRSDKVRHFVKALDVAMLTARNMRDLCSPCGSLRIFKSIFEPELDDERMQLGLT
jgi:hypothetical protein